MVELCTSKIEQKNLFLVSLCGTKLYSTEDLTLQKTLEFSSIWVSVTSLYMFSCFVWFYGETQWFHLLHLEISLPPQVLRSLYSWQFYALLLSLQEWQVGSGEKKERRYVRKGGCFVPYFAETPNQKMKVFRFLPSIAPEILRLPSAEWPVCNTLFLQTQQQRWSKMLGKGTMHSYSLPLYFQLSHFRHPVLAHKRRNNYQYLKKLSVQHS